MSVNLGEGEEFKGGVEGVPVVVPSMGDCPVGSVGFLNWSEVQ